MDERTSRLTVFFEEPFWVGVFERIDDGRLSVCKVAFGAEPKDHEILDFILKNHRRLKFSPSVAATAEKKAANPKRAQRQAHRQAARPGIGTSSRQALQLQREETRLTKKTASRAQRDAEKQRRFDLRQQKRKEMHRGR